MDNYFLGLLVTGGFVLYGIYALSRQVINWRKLNARKKWPVTTGTIASAETKFDNGNLGAKHYFTQCIYTYQVAGDEYRGGFVFDTFTGKEKAANDFAAEHCPGTTFTVYYNPDRTEECATDFDRYNVMQLLMPVLYLLFGFAGLMAMLARMKG